MNGKCTDCSGDISFSEAEVVCVEIDHTKNYVYPCPNCGRLNWQGGGGLFNDDRSIKFFFVNGQIVSRPVA